ncbi:NUDIX domain-containing protein [Actinomadura sp. KC345]|uniref:NUDIX hydrolase n=1 Tax=Actinomadura sp. KC345 TaxID=2530371 RepID=UPI00104B48BB|nr:NUDIX domain-containing protein [Actinomadura sp. KC345]TDC54973.1 NUDIX domain-containing protein [Actinomadura sp. KC345]
MDQITVSAVVIRDESGHVLTVRKRGTELLMFPGGKPERGESAEQAALREVAEELGVELRVSALRRLGEFTVPAANEPGHQLHATVFEHPFVEVSAPGAEIEHLEWIEPDPGGPGLAPLLRDAVFPALGGS